MDLQAVEDTQVYVSARGMRLFRLVARTTSISFRGATVLLLERRIALAERWLALGPGLIAPLTSRCNGWVLYSRRTSEWIRAMSVPTLDYFIDPILRYLVARPEGAAAREVHEAAAEVLGLTNEQKEELVPSGTQFVYKNRAGWAHDRLKRAGLSSSATWGRWQLTDAGRNLAQEHPAGISAAQIADIVNEHNDVRLGAAEASPVGVPIEVEALPASAVASPDDRLGLAISEMRESVSRGLLETLAGVSPTFFETIVLDVLHRMGYGASRADLQRVGGTGDGGIDGIISLDKLGLEKVYVQAKRWQGSVSRPEVQGFYGALAGQRANKGVMITTSTFTSQAIEFARSVERIVLVDGKRLAQLMIDHDVGVSSRTVRVPKIDSDYFDENDA